MANGFLASSPGSKHGADDEINQDDFAIAERFTCPGSGTVEISEIGIWAFKTGTDRGLKLAIYTDDSVNNCPESMVSNSEATLSITSTSLSKFSNTYATKPQLTGGVNYWLCAVWDAEGSSALYVNYAGGSGFSTLYRTQTYPSWPTGTEWHSHFDYPTVDYGIYAVYAAVAAAGNPFFSEFRGGLNIDMTGGL